MRRNRVKFIISMVFATIILSIGVFCLTDVNIDVNSQKAKIATQPFSPYFCIVGLLFILGIIFVHTRSKKNEDV